MAIIDGREVSKEILLNLEKEVSELNIKHIFPKLAVILVGKDQASLSYVRQKQKSCSIAGVEWEQFDYETDVTKEELIAKIEELNSDEKIHGFIIQLPLPKHIPVPLILKAISPKKDVDGATAYNIGKMFLSTEFEGLAPCTPLGIIRLLEHYKVELEGKEAVVVGRSNTVGKPLSIMLLNRNATVTICHARTKDLKAHTSKADILIVAVGKRNLITADMVKEGAVVIDVGINRNEEDKMCGDVDFPEVSKKASLITPVPGGVGPMTVASLIENTVKAAKRLNNIIN